MSHTTLNKTDTLLALKTLVSRIRQSEFMDDLVGDEITKPSKATRNEYGAQIKYLTGSTGGHHGEKEKGKNKSGHSFRLF